MHVLDGDVVSLKLTKDHFFVLSVAEVGLDLFEVVDDLRQLVRVSFLTACLFYKLLSFIAQLVDFVIKHFEHGFEICIIQFIAIDHCVVTMLSDCAAEADSCRAVFAETSDWLEPVLSTTVWLRCADFASLTLFS